MKHEVNVSSGITGDLPIDKPLERRAVCIRLALEVVPRDLWSDATPQERADAVVEIAKRFNDYITGGA